MWKKYHGTILLAFALAFALGVVAYQTYVVASISKKVVNSYCDDDYRPYWMR